MKVCRGKAIDAVFCVRKANIFEANRVLPHVLLSKKKCFKCVYFKNTVECQEPSVDIYFHDLGDSEDSDIHDIYVELILKNKNNIRIQIVLV